MNTPIPDEGGPAKSGPPAHPTGDPSEFSPAWMVFRRKVVLDTGSLFANGSAQAIVTCLAPALRARQERLLVLSSTVRSIAEAFATPGRTPSAKHRSAKEILQALEDADAWLCVNDPHAADLAEPRQTATLISDLVMTYQLEKAFCVVTQNERLARLLLRNANSPAIQGVQGVGAAYIDAGRFWNWIPRLDRRDGLKSAEVALERRIARDYGIIVDTSSLMLLNRQRDAAVGLAFFERRLLPQLLEHGTKMIVPQRVVNELQSHSKQPGAQQKVALEALRFLAHARDARAVVFAGDEDELATGNRKFADPVLVRAQRFQDRHNICFITQDTSLATLLLDNHDPSSGRDYQVVFVTIDGAALGNWEKKLADQAKRFSP